MSNTSRKTPAQPGVALGNLERRPSAGAADSIRAQLSPAVMEASLGSASGAGDLTKKVVGRLAPSPTGALHLGHARSFLIAWWHTRQQGGELLLRQEDLDDERSSVALRADVRADLEWLGIDWDRAEWVQSEHQAGILAAADLLVERGYAYPCVCSRGDIQSAVSAPHAGEVQHRYPETCRGKFNSLSDAERSTGKLAGLRARVPPGRWEFVDGVQGFSGGDVAREVGDFLILRRDKVPSYQLAVVVDDARQGVTEVVRGDDLLDSTPRQLFLHAALGLAPPRYYHVPLVLDQAGKRLAKRAPSASLSALRQRGVSPERIVQWVAESVGIPAHERVTPRDVLFEFDMARLPRTPVIAPDSW